jgi:hypothetical protein
MTEEDEILVVCRAVILSEIGRLDDLPNELANTVANIYYRCIPLGLDSSSSAEDLRSLVQRGHSRIQLGKILAARQMIPQMVAELRKLPKGGLASWAYHYAVQFALDLFKYDIPNGEKKSAARRSIERVFRKPLVREIPDLHRKLGLYGA